jgi:glycogen debranching enzyme
VPGGRSTSAHDSRAKRRRGGTSSKHRLLTQPEASKSAGIADALVIKDGPLAFLSRPDGTVPLEDHHGLGLYFHDCRFLSGYDLRVAGAHLEPLLSNAEAGFESVFQLTNADGDGAHARSRHAIGVEWRHIIDADHHTLRDELTFESYAMERRTIRVELAFAADFRDVFVIRGLTDERPGEQRPARWDDDELVLSYRGGDERTRELRIRFSKEPSWTRDHRVGFELDMASHAVERLMVSVTVIERDGERASADTHHRGDDARAAHGSAARRVEDWLTGFSRVRSSSAELEATVDRSLRDLRTLRMTIDHDRFFAAGIPWFVTLFGRDSLICALQTLAYRPEIAAETLRLLARFQGRKRDDWTEEEPGRILHELRVGELARMGKIPHTPYYGSIDSTPLFVILLAEHARWAGDLTLFQELRREVDAALRWMTDRCDHDEDGYLAYATAPGGHLINEGWKDSGSAIVDSSGRLGEPPVALVEVQGYVFMAKRAAADLFEQAGEHERAARSRSEADELAARFERDFWMEDHSYYALARLRGGRHADVISSNPGQALWTGIVRRERVSPVVDRLMAGDMFSGWGIRTLAASERAYNPVGYHLGTVWPHDNSLIAAGLRRNGFDAEACRVFSGLLDAARHFEHHRLPEVFSGFGREELAVPARYPVACHPQAWASGAIPFMLQSLLGLEPDAFRKRLHVVRPCLPAEISELRFERLRVGSAEVDLRFARHESGELSVDVDRRRGDLEVVVDHARD